MSDKLLSLLAEFRYWRASAPVGLAIGLWVSLTVLAQWPDLATPGLVFSEPLNALTSSVGTPVLWVLAIVAMFLVGGWWCDFAMVLLARVQVWAVKSLPLAEQPQHWPWWSRLVSPVPLSDVATLQVSMEQVGEYRDLVEGDRRGAYRTFLREVFTEPHSALGLNGALISEIVRGLTEVRAVAGLLPWLPLAMAATASHMTAPYASLAHSLRLGAALTAALLILGTWLQARSVAGHTVRALADDASRLARHARAAINSGRQKSELDAANDTFD